jgi:hypothetical protein
MQQAGLRLRVLPALGDRRLSELRRVDVQEFVEWLGALEFNPSTIQVTLLPLQAICRRAVSRGTETAQLGDPIELRLRPLIFE